MNITTIIELENQEVESMAGAELVFTQEQIDDSIIETCVEGFQLKDSNEFISSDEGMQMVFRKLKQQGIIPEKVEDFSYEMPSCERIKQKTDSSLDNPQKVILSFMS